MVSMSLGEDRFYGIITSLNRTVGQNRRNEPLNQAFQKAAAVYHEMNLLELETEQSGP